MKVLKFTQGDSEPPSILYLTEGIRFNEIESTLQDKLLLMSESIQFNESMSVLGILLMLTEGIQFNMADLQHILLNLSEEIQFEEGMYQKDYVLMLEKYGFEEAASTLMGHFIELEENIGFTSGGYAFIDNDYKITWRTRTKLAGYGMGGAEYGNNVSYGDGNAADLDKFTVKIYDSRDDTLLRSTDITIMDTDNPDDDAEFIYTVAMNITDNGYYNPNLKIEVYQVDTNAEISLPKNIYIEPFNYE